MTRAGRVAMHMRQDEEEGQPTMPDENVESEADVESTFDIESSSSLIGSVSR